MLANMHLAPSSSILLLQFYLTLHECLLCVQLSCHELNEVVILDSDDTVSLSLFIGILDRASAILQIEQPRTLRAILRDIESKDGIHLLHQRGVTLLRQTGKYRLGLETGWLGGSWSGSSSRGSSWGSGRSGRWRILWSRADTLTARLVLDWLTWSRTEEFRTLKCETTN